jgi:hypothetical protein
MTDLDERFAAALRDAVPQPPHQLDPQEIRDRSGRRRGTLRRYAPALAAAVVVAVAIGTQVRAARARQRNNRPRRSLLG